MARPSNQWATRRPPISNRAGVTRTSAPLSQAGSSPVTGSRSTDVSSSRLWKPSRWSVAAVCESEVAMVKTIPSSLDYCNRYA